MVMIQQATQNGLALNLVWSCRFFGIAKAQGNQVVEPLVGTMVVMVMLDSFQHMAKMTFAQKNHVIQGLPDFPDMSFCEGVALGSPGRGFDHLDAFGFYDGVERLKGAIAIMDEVSTLLRNIIQHHTKVSGLLAGPLSVGVGRASGNVNSSGAQMNVEQDVEGDQAMCSPDLLGEEIRRPDDIHMRGNELFP